MTISCLAPMLPKVSDTKALVKIIKSIKVVARFFCCFSVLFGFVAVGMFLMGMTCSHLGQSPGSKKKLRCTAGVLMVLGGALIRKFSYFLDVVKRVGSLSLVH